MTIAFSTWGEDSDEEWGFIKEHNHDDNECNECLKYYDKKSCMCGKCLIDNFNLNGS